MVTLLRLCEPSKRGNRNDWKFDDENDDPSDQLEDPSPPEEDNMKCPTDVCIICYSIFRRSASNPPSHRFPSKRSDPLRRPLIDSHLLHAHDGISCNWEGCRNLSRVAKVTESLAHASTAHKHNIKTRLCHLPRMPEFSDSDSFYREASRESETRQGTETPASLFDFDMANIDPRLMEPLTCTPSTEIFASSNRCPVQ